MRFQILCRVLWSEWCRTLVSFNRAAEICQTHGCQAMVASSEAIWITIGDGDDQPRTRNQEQQQQHQKQQHMHMHTHTHT